MGFLQNTATLFVLILPALTEALQPTYFISAPNVIRVGVDETIVISILGDVNTAVPVPVTVKLQNYPLRTTTYANQIVNVKKNEPQTVTLRVSPDAVDSNINPNNGPEYVYLHASSQSAAFQFQEGTEILLSYKAGYTFIQTDKPIYTPNKKVYIRLLTMNQQMRPSQEKVRIDVLTPQDVIVKRFDDVTPIAGFVNKTYEIPVLAAFGNWTVAAYYGHEMKHKTTVQFFVKEYTLPRFSVKISVQPDLYILPSSQEITTLIKGEYVYGNVVGVKGFYRIRYHLLDGNGNLELIKDGINGTLNEHGQYVHSLLLSDILGDNDFDDILGKRLHIEAFIVESATGQVESSNYTVLQFVDSPFIFNWDETRKYFKTNLPIEVKVDVIYCYGEPVRNLDVRVSAIAHLINGQQQALTSEEELKQNTDNLGRVRFRLNYIPDIQRLSITMTTIAGGVLANFEQTETFTLLPFLANGNNELLIRHATQLVSVNNSLSVDLFKAESENVDAIFTYIVAGGKITLAKAIERVAPTLTVYNIHQITQDMVPSARMVAFYVNDNNQVIADSVWIDVNDTCENPVKVTVSDNAGPHLPGSTVSLKLEGKQQTKIALLAVDAAVYLLKDYHRLNKRKVFARMASYDLGCGPGGGRDTQDIFKNAGITVLTNANFETQKREDLSCDEHNRRRRSVQDGERYNLQDLLNEYDGNDTLTTYCERGQTLVEGWTCEKRAQGLARRKGWDQDHPNAQALFRCCVAVSQAAGRSASGPPQPAPKIDFGDVHIRSMFPESWLFDDELVDLGNNTSKQYYIPLPHSITTWIIQAVGMSPLHGMCVADNKEIVVHRECFLDVALPYSVKRKEQVVIQATVYNYNKAGQQTRVTLMMKGVDGLCSNAIPGDDYEDEFEFKEGVVEGGTAKSFSFIVIPLEVQDFVITIYMFSASFGNDAVQKTLHVVPEGTRQFEPLSILLDPARIRPHVPQNVTIDHGNTTNLIHNQAMNEQAETTQGDVVMLAMPADIVPDTTECEISLIGTLLGPVASAFIDGLDFGSLLIVPYGCGEQTMVSMAPNVYIYDYLKSIGKDKTDIEENAVRHIDLGYNRMMNNYLTQDGAFGFSNGGPANSWLTAFVVRVFCKAKDLSDSIEEKRICEGMKWLVRLQKQDGSFNFAGIRSMMGGVNEPIPLTAFVLITLSECNCPSLDITDTARQATMFLENQFAGISQDAHTLAIVTYALALVNSAQANTFNAQLRLLNHSNAVQGTTYFGSPGGGALTVETTAYALLAQVTLGEISYSFPIVQWLMLQRTQIGIWRSTQDTMVALQALSEYAQQAHTGDINMACLVEGYGNYEHQWEVNSDNAFVLQATQAPSEGILKFTTRGTGIATLSVNLNYYRASGNDDQCPFEVNVTSNDMKADPALPGAPDGEKPKKKLEIHICAKYTGTGHTNMAIIDVGLLSGFIPIDKTLQKVIEDTTLIPFYEVTINSVIFYVDEIPVGDPLCVTFEAHQPYEVGNVQPVPVKVYDYYQPERECIKYYRPDDKSPLLETICDEQDQVCDCVAASCLNKDPKLPLSDFPGVKDLKTLACIDVSHFAYKASFVELKKETFEVFTMNVIPLKKGLDQQVHAGQSRKFWKSLNCEQPMIEEGYDYLIIGNGGIPVTDKNGDIAEYRHFFNGRFTVIQWPTEAQRIQAKKDCKTDCPMDSNNKSCKKQCARTQRDRKEYFEAVETEFTINGCPK